MGNYRDEAANEPVVSIGTKIYDRSTSPSCLPSDIALSPGSPQTSPISHPPIHQDFGASTIGSIVIGKV